MRITYMGLGNREVTTEDLERSGLDISSLKLSEGEAREYFWHEGETIEVDDVVGEFLAETHRSQFKSADLTTRDLRSKDELYHLAQQLQIPNRSTMNRDELASAVDGAIAAKANESEGAETPQDVLDQLDAEGI